MATRAPASPHAYLALPAFTWHGGHGTVLRSLRTPFMNEWGAKREEARRERERLWTEIQARTRAGRRHETLLTAGQTSGGIGDILPVAEIIRQLTAEAVLSQAPRSV
jgi:NAD(P)H-dependent flavin oxidoreductase YrpB (nitropropane dioxygenase family)